MASGVLFVSGIVVGVGACAGEDLKEAREPSGTISAKLLGGLAGMSPILIGLLFDNARSLARLYEGGVFFLGHA